MVLISIYPFAPKRIALLAAAVLGLTATSAFADSLFLSVKATPYDRQMTRIQPVLFTSAGSGDRNVSLGAVNAWIQDLRTIPYGFSMQWKTPSEVATSSAADCKGKAVALYERMRHAGARDVRLVIGRRSSGSRMTHTWVEWTTGGSTYVLDPTINWRAFDVRQTGSQSYIPLYAYSGARKYRAAGASLYARL